LASHSWLVWAPASEVTLTLLRGAIEGQRADAIARLEAHAADSGLAHTIVERSRELVDLCDDALTRFELGTYGRCVGCDTGIPIDRLEAIPYTPTCVSCSAHRGSTA